MPEHEQSLEARWLAETYRSLSQYDGRWIAVVGTEIVDSDPDPIALATRVGEQHEEGSALFASVTSDRVG